MINRHKFIQRLIHGSRKGYPKQLFGINEMYREVMLLCDLLDHFNFGKAKLSSSIIGEGDVQVTFDYERKEIEYRDRLYTYMSVNDQVEYSDNLYSIDTTKKENKVIIRITREVI